MARMHRLRRIWPIAILVLLVAAGACGTAGTGGVQPTTPTATPAASPAVSAVPAAGQLLFVRALGATADGPATEHAIYVVDGDGANLRRLSPAGVHDRFPVWSPDGTKIAFDRETGTTVPGAPTVGPRDVWVMDADGGNARRLTDGKGYAFTPTWSPDGTRIAFVRMDLSDINDQSQQGPPPGTISVVYADGSIPRTIAVHALDGLAGLSWSPDGTKLAYAEILPFDIMGIAIVGMDGKVLAHITEPDRGLISPVWSPDGKRIAFLSMNLQPSEQQGPGPGLLRIDVAGADGADPQAVSGLELAAAFFQAWSPDARQIAFVGSMPPEGTGPRAAGLYRVNADGSGLRQIGPDRAAPAWSPDGRSIALLVMVESPAAPQQAPSAELRVMAPDGSNVRVIASGIFVDPVADPFDSEGSPAPVWWPVKP